MEVDRVLRPKVRQKRVFGVAFSENFWGRTPRPPTLGFAPAALALGGCAAFAPNHCSELRPYLSFRLFRKNRSHHCISYRNPAIQS